MKPLLLIFAGVALLAACQPAPPRTSPEEPAPTRDTCGASALQTLIGRPARVLETMKFATVVRIIRPGMAVTMDYVPDRLNIEIDADGDISRVTCG